ncbi:MAG: asparagine synthetase B [Candidatus Tectimicrobiota bacterium]|nr:MAG: asparagine synthetase B [Candidatus Tectomicrobia bacterium]
MCGIAGQICPAGVEAARVRRMLQVLRHRGPDDEGLYCTPEAALGQRRLAIIDLAGGHQPLANEDGTVWVVFNGEIYNYQALRRELEAKGHRFATRSDTEVLVHLYEDLGAHGVTRLRGMFAFALWDSRQRRLVAARDRLGQKPFFYVERGGELLFASEIKALLAFDPTLAELDREALDQYLSLRLIAPPRTMFRAVRKLPPAHLLTFTPDAGVKVERYWDLHYEPKLVGTEDELLEALEACLLDCLRLHLVSDVPVGAFLSGGLDSTLVVAMLMKHGIGEPLQTFSMGLPYKAYDEAPYARLVARQYGTRHHEKRVTPSLVRLLPRLVWHLDEPSDPLALCTYLIAQMAREHVKVVLGGDGGDELFGGYDRYYGNLYADYYARLPAGLRRGVLGPLLAHLPEGRWYKSLAHRLKWLHHIAELQGGARYARSLSYFYFPPAWRQALYGPAMREVLAHFDPEAALREPFVQAQAEAPLDRMLYADSQVRLPDHSVMILDRMTMAHGLEARSPLMDHEVAEFAARLPVHLKVRGRKLRYLQKRLAQKYLPAPLLRRPKQGFSSALPYLLREEYRVLFRRFLASAHLGRDGLLQQAVVDRLLTEHLSRRADHGNRLWLLLNAEVWYRMFIERTPVAQLSEELAGVDTQEAA